MKDIQITSVLDDNLWYQLGELLFNEWQSEFYEFRSLSCVNDIVNYYKTKSSCKIFVAYICKKLVGCVMIEDNDWNVANHLTPWLSNVLIHHEYRNNNIGSHLINHALQDHQSRPLYVWTSNFELVAFYKHFGFDVLFTNYSHGSIQDITILKKLK